MSTDSAKAGKYELLVDHFQQWTADNKSFTNYSKGEIVTLTADEAERLVSAGAVGHPGAVQQAEAERLQAEADAAKEAADAAKERAAQAAKDATAASKAPASSS